MNLLSLFSLLLITIVCGCGALAADIEAPSSIKGASIKVDGRKFNPPFITIEKYVPKGSKAELIMHCNRFMRPRSFASYDLAGIKANDETSSRKAKAAVITFTGRKGNIYYGTVEGSLSSTYGNCRDEDDSEEKEEKTILNNKSIKIIFPAGNRPQTGTVDAPKAIKDGALIQIQTEQEILEYQLGRTKDTFLAQYIPEETTATIELNLSDDVFLSGEESFEEVEDVIMTYDERLPHIVFTEKSGNTYKGDLHGYLYRCKIDPKTKDSPDPKLIITFKEKLVSITITLP